MVITEILKKHTWFIISTVRQGTHLQSSDSLPLTSHLDETEQTTKWQTQNHINGHHLLYRTYENVVKSRRHICWWLLYLNSASFTFHTDQIPCSGNPQVNNTAAQVCETEWNCYNKQDWLSSPLFRLFTSAQKLRLLCWLGILHPQDKSSIIAKPHLPDCEIW